MARMALTAIVVALALSLASAQRAVKYPQTQLTPPLPSMNDSVSLRLILGVNSNSCVPTYSSSFKVAQVSNNVCVRYPCPQNFVITLSYTQLPPLPLGRPCLRVITSYGPRFAFGKLAVGSYKVYDGVAKDTMTSFYVTENAVITLHDTVQVLPANPTTRDSLTLNLFLADACCCSAIYSQSVGIIDTIIYLSYQIDNNPCMLCDCVAAGKTFAFKSGPVKAGKYGIYKEESSYCPPGTPCPYMALMPVRVGSVTVRAATTVEQPQGMPRCTVAPAAGALTARYDICGRALHSSSKRAIELLVVRSSTGASFAREKAGR